MPATNYAINNELNAEFRSGTGGGYSPALPNSWYIGLSLSEISDDGIGVLEPSGGGYMRVGLTRGTSHWTTVTSGSLSNNIDVVFPYSTKHWGTIQEIFISSSSRVGTSGSYIWFHSKLETPMSVISGTKITIPKSAIAINRKE